ncbi:hypothetical protein ACFOWX_11790 [Sphingorhabdus arenilitoris]|uniref:DUF1036 domain-containing protein n=1 Tax=Sphingorhabdus arenilitoris TaxID=1490041 RepID=A0ABV8RIA9_9SPHN
MRHFLSAIAMTAMMTAAPAHAAAYSCNFESRGTDYMLSISVAGKSVTSLALYMSRAVNESAHECEMSFATGDGLSSWVNDQSGSYARVEGGADFFELLFIPNGDEWSLTIGGATPGEAARCGTFALPTEISISLEPSGQCSVAVRADD